MEKQIKVGDRVVFHGRDEDGSTDDVKRYFRPDSEQLGRSGTVTEIEEGSLLVVLMDSGYELYGWDADRFAIVSEQPKFRAGDIVTPNDAPVCGFTLGKEYTVKAANGDSIDLESDDDGDTDRFRPAHEFDLVRRPSETPAEVFLIIGPRGLLTTEYATREAAEEFLKADGDNGKDFRIFQEVARYRVNRTANLETI